jgi:hypothetical protein
MPADRSVTKRQAALHRDTHVFQRNSRGWQIHPVEGLRRCEPKNYRAHWEVDRCLITPPLSGIANSAAARHAVVVRCVVWLRR